MSEGVAAGGGPRKCPSSLMPGVWNNGRLRLAAREVAVLRKKRAEDWHRTSRMEERRVEALAMGAIAGRGGAYGVLP